MVVRQEQFITNKAGTLNGGITDSATSLTINSATGWPAAGDWRVEIDNELILVTAVSGTTWTITRGIEGTTAAAHSNGAAVTALCTKGGLEQWQRDNDPWVDSRYPMKLLDKDGNTLTNSSFTELNFTGATASMVDGGIKINKDTTATIATAFLYRTPPATPWTVTACLLQNSWAQTTTEGPRFGVFMMEDSSNDSIRLVNQPNANTAQTGLRLLNWKSLTSTSGLTAKVAGKRGGMFEPMWFRMKDDGTDVWFYFSRTGIFDDTTEFFKEGRTVSLGAGPDQIGIHYDAFNAVGDNTAIYCTAWIEEDS